MFVGRVETLSRFREIAATKLFPGSRAVWVGAVLAFVVAAFLAARVLSADTPPILGTNSVDYAAVIAGATTNDTFCIADLDVPRGTGRVEIALSAVATERARRVRATLNTGASNLRLSHGQLPTSVGYATFTLDTPTTRSVSRASVCLEITGYRVEFGGASVQSLPERPATSIDGRPLGALDVSTRFLAPEEVHERVIDEIPAALKRATVFAGPVEIVLVYCSIPGLLLLVYGGVRITATSDRRRIRTLALLAAVFAFAHAATWAVLLHPFHGADESEHFAYAQYLATTDQSPDRATSSPDRSPYSTSEIRLLEALHHNSTILNTTSRLRWNDDWARRYGAAAIGTSESDGGGGTESATGHSPLYYAYVGIPYRLLHHEVSLPSVILAMRLWSALLAAIVAACATLIVAAAFGASYRQAAWVAGLTVALQPVFGSVSGAINNDTAVNVTAAGFLLALVLTWRHGPSTRNAAVVGTLLILMPVAKITGFALAPVFLVAAIVVALRHGIRATVAWSATIVVVLAVAAAGWSFAVSPAVSGERGRIVNVHKATVGTPAGSPATSEGRLASLGIGLKLRYFEQTFSPILPIGTRLWALPGSGIDAWPAYYIYIKRGYGLFGWQSTAVGTGLLHLIFYALLLGWCCTLVTLVRARRCGLDLGGAAILAAAIGCVLLFISAAYATDSLHTDAGEQGRYVFTALPALSALFAIGPLGFGTKARSVLFGAYAGGAASLAPLLWVSALRGWFI